MEAGGATVGWEGLGREVYRNRLSASLPYCLCPLLRFVLMVTSLQEASPWQKVCSLLMGFTIECKE
jgi:hypothetical protein